jgi:anaerobic selenocysteine-containing dehydrogenase
MQETTLTRRSFVQAVTIAGAALALGTRISSSLEEADKAWAATDSDLKMYYSSCHGCIQNCPCKVYVRDGVVVKLEGDKRAPTSLGSMCMKGTNQLHTLYSPRRVLYPLKRAGARGAEDLKWERITWDQAVEEASTAIADAIKKYGTYAYFTSTGGGGGYSFALTNSMNMSVGSPNVIEPGCAQCYLPRVSLAAWMYSGQDQSIADSATLEPWKGVNPQQAAQGIQNEMGLLVSWGAQPSVSQTAQSGRAVAEMRELTDQASTGVDTIVIDPNYSPDAVKATYWLRVRPGADGGLLLSWFREIFHNKWYDEEFSKYWTNLPFVIDPDTLLPLLATDVWPDYQQTTPANTPVYVCWDLRTNSLQPMPFSAPEDSPVDPEIFWGGEVNGKSCKSAGQIYYDEAEPWTFEYTEEICWVPAATNKAAVELYAHPKNKWSTAGIANGVATDMMQDASQVPLGCLGLDMIMGYVNKPGCTLTQNLRALPNPNAPITRPVRSFYQDGVGYTIGMTEEENRARAETFPDKDLQYIRNKLLLDRLGMRNYKGLYNWSHSHIPTVLEAIQTGEPFQPRVWYDTSGNKLAMLGDSSTWYDIFNKIDFCLCQYPMITSFQAEICDIMFPLEEWAETTLMASLQLNLQWPMFPSTHLGETVPNYVGPQLMVVAISEKLNAAIDQVVIGAIGAATGTANPINLNSSQETEAVDSSTRKFTFPLGSQIGTINPDGSETPRPNGWLTGGFPDEATYQKMTILSRFKDAADWDSLINNEDQYVNDETLVMIPPDAYWAYGQHEIIANDGLPVGFGTESRKCEVYCSMLIKLANTGWPFTYPIEQVAPDPEIGFNNYKGTYSPICQHVEPVETPLESHPDYDPEYPLAITSGRLYYFHHGTMRHAAFARELYPVPDVRIHPDTAKEYGIEHMDWVEVTSRRGSIRGRAYITSSQHKKVLWMERFWNPECFDSSQKTKTGGWRECNINVITKESAPHNEVFGSYTNRGFQVNIKKSTRPDRIWVEPEEFAPFLPSNKNQYAGDAETMLQESATALPTLPKFEGGVQSV